MAVALIWDALVDPGVFGMMIDWDDVRRRKAGLGVNKGLKSDEVALGQSSSSNGSVMFSLPPKGKGSEYVARGVWTRCNN
jgi:hypothetical protein